MLEDLIKNDAFDNKKKKETKKEKERERKRMRKLEKKRTEKKTEEIAFVSDSLSTLWKPENQQSFSFGFGLDSTQKNEMEVEFLLESEKRVDNKQESITKSEKFGISKPVQVKTIRLEVKGFLFFNLFLFFCFFF